MVHDEKLKKVCNDFSLLNDEQQDYILGILQALVFAKNSGVRSDSEKAGPASASGNQNTI
jgi:hypothetical protein